MHTVSRVALAVATLALSAQAGANVTLYENNDYQGRSFVAERPVNDLRQYGFNDRASSIVVDGDRADRWEVCDDSRFRGRCVVLRRGEYPSLSAIGLNDRISSVRAVARSDNVDPARYAPLPAAPAERINQIVFYENEDFGGRTFTADTPVADFRGSGFNERASSAVVTGERWEVCQDARYGGRCVVLRRGEYPSLAAMGLNDQISSARGVGRSARLDENRYAPPPPPPVAPAPARRVVFYENDGFNGRTLTADTQVADFRASGFNDRASSAVVSGSLWEVCDDIRYSGRCVVLRPGQYASLSAMGLNDRISSARAVNPDVRVDDGRYAPLPLVSHDYGRRNDERTYQATITSVRAVVENSGQRCWIEPGQAVQEQRGSANVPGALLGAVIGGILGHQVGGGSGRDVATGVGVVAGAAIGANTNRADGGQQVVTTQPVQRCVREPGQAHPAYWDVTYNFRGQEHRMQMTTAPGSTVTVNAQGEPRA